MSARASEIEAATARLGREETVPALLTATGRTLVDLLGASACTISRVIGDLLVDLAQYRGEGEPLRLGHGYLISDYPLTRQVIEELEPRAVALSDPEADAGEARLLRELGFDSLLMVPLEVRGGVWGLVEVYGAGRDSFGPDAPRVAVEVVRRAGVVLGRLEGRP